MSGWIPGRPASAGAPERLFRMHPDRLVQMGEERTAAIQARQEADRRRSEEDAQRRELAGRWEQGHGKERK